MRRLILIAAAAAAVFELGAACIQPPPDLTSWWTFDEAGGGAVFDIVSENDGFLVNGASQAAGKVGFGGAFDGVNDYVLIPHDASLNPDANSFSVDFWVKPAAGAPQNFVIKHEFDADPLLRKRWSVSMIASGVIQYVIQAGTGAASEQLTFLGTTPIDDGAWHLVAMVIDRGSQTLRTYVDGLPDNQTGWPNISGISAISPNADLFLSASTNALDGLLDEVEITARALDELEILELYFADEQGKCKTAGPQPGVCTIPPADMVSWWDAENNAFDKVGVNSGTLVNGATYAPGKVGTAFSFSGPTDYVLIPHDPSQNPGADSFSVDLWFRSNTPGVNQNIFIKHQFNADVNLRKRFSLRILDTGQLNIHFQAGTGNAAEQLTFSGTTTVDDGAWHLAALVVDRVEQRFKLYVDGSPDNGLNWPDISGISAVDPVADLNFGSSSTPLSGELDEVEFIDRALSREEVEALFLAGSAGKCAACTPEPVGLAAWWRAEGDALDSRGGHDGIVSGGLGYSAGMVGQAFDFDGVDDYVRVPHSVLLNPGGGSFSADFWVKTPPATTPSQHLLIKHQSNANVYLRKRWGLLITAAGTLEARLESGDGTTTGRLILTGTTAIDDDQWHLLAYVVDRSDQTLKIYVDGVLDTQGSIALIPSVDPIADLYISANISFFEGLMDEIEILPDALSASDLQHIYLAGGEGKCLDLPPVAICQNVTIDCPGDASIDNGSYDPDDRAVSLSQSPPGPYPTGTTTVTLTVTDANGDMDTCQADVTVIGASCADIESIVFTQYCQELQSSGTATLTAAIALLDSLIGDALGGAVICPDGQAQNASNQACVAYLQGILQSFIDDLP